VTNELALRHAAGVAPRQDTAAGPAGRRGDQVGGFTLMEREDLRRVLPLWLRISEDVRFDPEVGWNAGRGVGGGDSRTAVIVVVGGGGKEGWPGCVCVCGGGGTTP
jgi:hypothetical protein